MSGTFRIELNRSRAVAVSICLIASGILLFAAGIISGLLLSSASLSRETAKTEAARGQYNPISTKQAKAPTSAAASAAGSSLESQSVNPPALAALPPAPQSAAPAVAPSPASQPAPSPAPPAPSSSGAPANPTGKASTTSPAAEPDASNTADSAPLAVKVCSFTGKSSAENLVTALDAKGYRASMIHSVGAQGRMWYVVMLGPYKEWDSAAEIAARVAVAENVRPVVGQVP